MASRFQLPQFIEHETKVVGPLTLKQSMYLVGPLVFAFFLYFLLPFGTFIIAALVLEGLGALLNFVKIGGKSLPGHVTSLLRFTAGPKNFIWKKGNYALDAQGKAETTYGALEEEPASDVQMTQTSRVRNLSTQVQTKR